MPRLEAYTIWHAFNRRASPKAGEEQYWDEWQVKLGRRIVARFDLKKHAVAYADKLAAERDAILKGAP